MTSESFFEYVLKVFHPWLVKEKVKFPVILYLDNHSSHITRPLVTECRKLQIELIGLYPCATHIMQPMDIAFFHPLKEKWKKILPKWKIENEISCLRKDNFAAALKVTLDSLKEEKKIIINGFRAAGLMPFNENAIDYNLMCKKGKKRGKKGNEKESSVDEFMLSSNESSESLNLLNFLEKKLPLELLRDFQNAESDGVWPGLVEQKALFELWLGLKNNGISRYFN